MAVKRKFDAELEDADAGNSVSKQLRLIPFPMSQPSPSSSSSYTDDSDMMDVEPSPIFDMGHPHSRLTSSASTSSIATSISYDAPAYPSFDIYPHPHPLHPARSGLTVGLLQPSQSSFTHHNGACTTIPKLRIACEAGSSGRRSMWAFCEDCGSVEIVDS